MTSDIAVFVRGGEYRLNNTHVFDQDDSDTHGFSVVYRAAPNETTVTTREPNKGFLRLRARLERGL